jgi:hypothetical protein
MDKGLSCVGRSEGCDVSSVQGLDQVCLNIVLIHDVRLILSASAEMKEEREPCRFWCWSTFRIIEHS